MTIFVILPCSAFLFILIWTGELMNRQHESVGSQHIIQRHMMPSTLLAHSRLYLQHYSQESLDWHVTSNVINKQMNSILCLDSLLADLKMKGRGQWLCSMLYFFISKAVDTAAWASQMIMQSPISCKGVKGKGLHSVWISVCVGGLSNVDPQKQAHARQ